MSNSRKKVSPSESIMVGAGFYNLHSDLQAGSAALAMKTLREIARLIPILTESACFTIMDYGCSEGKNSLRAISEAIESLRSRNSAIRICVIHADQPTNDFSSLFTMLNNEHESYLSKGHIYSLAVGRSFYQQLVPDGTVALGWCSHAIHWLSQCPHVRATSLWSSQLGRPMLKTIAIRAAEDWDRFLLHRSRELISGGRLLIVASLRGEDGNIGVEAITRLVDKALSEMVESGSLSIQDRERMLMPTYYRNEEEFRAPFVSERLENQLYLERFESVRQLNPFESLRSEPEKFAHAITQFVRAFTEQFLRSCIISKSQSEVDRFIEHIYARVKELATEASDMEISPRIVVLTIRRTERTTRLILRAIDNCPFGRFSSVWPIRNRSSANRYSGRNYLHLSGNSHRKQERGLSMYTKKLDNAEPFECAGVKFAMVLPRDVTGSVEVVWERLEPFQGTPEDRHQSFDQLFYILKGTGRVMVGEETEQLEPQSIVLIPQGTRHSIASTSDLGLEYLFINVWKAGIPEKEVDWRVVYSQINDRRLVEVSARAKAQKV